MRKRKLNILLILFIVILLFGLGYAYLTTTLSINGTTDVDSNTWNIYWDNVQVRNGSVTASTPTIDTSKTTVTFNVHLSKPGDFYEFTVDEKNDGSIDAMIDTITKTTTIPNYINYSVTYADDGIISKNQLLAASSKEVYKVRVEYRTDINANELPNASQSLSLSFGVTYVQADNNSINVIHTLYTSVTGRYGFLIGSPVPQDAVYYYNYMDTAQDTLYGELYFLKHIVEDNIIKEQYGGFVYNNNLYYLRGGIDETSLTTKTIYEQNKAIVLSIFDESECHDIDSNDNMSLFTYCGSREFNISIRDNGSITFGTSQSYGCHISQTWSFCEYND